MPPMANGSFVFSFLARGASTRSRLIELVDAAKVAGLITYASTEVSFLSYPEVQKLPGALLAERHSRKA